MKQMPFKLWHMTVSGSLFPPSSYVKEEIVIITADIIEHLLCAKHCGTCLPRAYFAFTPNPSPLSVAGNIGILDEETGSWSLRNFPSHPASKWQNWNLKPDLTSVLCSTEDRDC